MTISNTDIRLAADDLREHMSLRLGELADKLLGRPEFGTPEWMEDRRTQYTPEGQERLKLWHLTKIRICAVADVEPVGDVINARKVGASWDEIGAACEMTAQAAADRWAVYADTDR
jgi:hypothetical protein